MIVTPPDEVRLEHLVDVGLIVAVDVERQRLATARDVPDDFIDVLVSHHRHDRREDLLLHDLHVGSDIGEQRRMDRAVGLLQRAAHGDLGALGNGIIEELLDAREILVVDDLGDAFLLDAAVVPVEVLLHLRPELLDQGALLLLLDEHVVGTDAGLPAVELLGCRQVPRDLLHIRAFIDDDG